MARGRKDFKAQALADVAPAVDEAPSVQMQRLGERAGTNRLAGARMIAVERLQLDDRRLRTTIAPGSLEKLAESIAVHGVIHPLTVVYDEQQDIYVIVNGARRFLAAQEAGLIAVPCLVAATAGDSSQEQQLVENLQRENLPVLAEAEAIAELCRTFNLTQREAARRIGKPKSYINELLRIRRLPSDVKERIVRNPDIPKTTLLMLARLDDPETIRTLFTQIETHRLTTEELRRHQDYPRKTKPGRPPYHRFSYKPPHRRYSLTITFQRHRIRTGDVVKVLREALAALGDADE